MLWDPPGKLTVLMTFPELFIMVMISVAGILKKGFAPRVVVRMESGAWY